MKKINFLEIPDFSVTKTITHPSFPFLKIEAEFTPESVDVEIDNPDIEEEIVQSSRGGNLAAWFKTKITVFSDDYDLDSHMNTIEKCTYSSFDDFLEEELFWIVVNEMVEDISIESQSNPLLFDLFMIKPRMVS